MNKRDFLVLFRWALDSSGLDRRVKKVEKASGGPPGGGAEWGDITGTLSAQTDLQTALDGKAASSHTHTIANTTGLQAALDGKAASTHSHAISDVTGLQTALDGKQAAGSYAAASHTHAAADVTSGTLDIARIPTGTSASTVALGNHTHTQYAPVRVRNYSTASQGAGFATDTYVTGSSLQIPTGGMVAGMRFEWTITASKTAASTAVPSYNVRIGSNQSTADTSRLALTASAAQTAVTDAGVLTVSVIVRSVGASGVIAGGSGWASRGGATGFGGGASNVSASFDNSNLAGQFIGLSMNGGASAAWTVQSVYAELVP